jgi:hypothetical protein
VPSTSPSGYLGGSSALRLLPRFSPVPTPTPFHTRKDTLTQLTSIVQALKTLLASSARLEKVLSGYFGGPRYTIIPRPLIMDPFSSFLREFRESHGQDVSLDATSDRIQVNLRNKHLCLPIYPRLSFKILYWGEHSTGVYRATLAHYTQSPTHDAKFATTMYTASKACIQICNTFNQPMT